MSATRKQDYAYTKINQIKDATYANFYGVVKYFKHPTRVASGDEYCLSFRINDETSRNGIACIWFAKIQDLPTKMEVGDIIRLHRAKIGTFGDRGLQSKNSKFASW